ncbi:hypothetical protein [Pseudomonas sp. GM30]|uniref:hypothetical protein n=1 Tax=Pseudomonas sp. GM30 TaxID=1144328 RepID=UPI000270462D|nr:hypothetical protein [Pseudomonas sp. GM30]EUB85288.1 hypothetical protein PMI25_000773 [Pseudomonas sp. GM30]
MDETYKVLFAALVGFMISPLNELLKKYIETWLCKKKLMVKIDSAIRSLGTAIKTLNQTSIDRQEYIKKEKNDDTAFMQPYLKVSKMEDDVEKSYTRLSENQKYSIDIAISGLSHVSKIENRITQIYEDMRDTAHNKAYNGESFSKDDQNRYHRRILSAEKAMIYSLVSIRQRLISVKNNIPMDTTDLENLEFTSKELSIVIDTATWKHLQ